MQGQRGFVGTPELANQFGLTGWNKGEASQARGRNYFWLLKILIGKGLTILRGNRWFIVPLPKASSLFKFANFSICIVNLE